GLAGGGRHPLASVVTSSTSLVLLRMPRSLARLDAVARAVAAEAGPDAGLLAGNRVKHMTPTQNEVLAASFARVDVTHARAKSRISVGREPRAGLTAPAPDMARLEPPSGAAFTVIALPGVFAGASLDIGTRELLATFDELPPFERAIDLACGTGTVA